MAGMIVNLSNRPVSVRLNTGVTRHIPPRANLGGIRAAEVDGNAMIDKLVTRRVLALRDFNGGPKSGDLSAGDAIAHIKNTPLEDLGDFLSDDEERVTVLRAMEEKKNA